jgi:hypothetical protein
VKPYIATSAVGGLAGLLLSERKIPHSEWTTMFSRWTGPASATEELRIRNTEAVVKKAISQGFGASSVDLKFIPQGSSTNNTNVKNKSDLDIIVLNEAEEWHRPDRTGNYPTLSSASGEKLTNVYKPFRQRVGAALSSSFELLMSIDDGNKAIKLSPFSDARVDCDVLPAFRVVVPRESRGLLTIPQNDEGIIFCNSDGESVISFPEQHLENGRQKNINTGYRYKQIVRVMKKLRDRFQANSGLLTVSRQPSSYEIECLVYNIPSANLTEGTLYDCVLSSASWLKNALSKGYACNNLLQVHRVYSMFPHWGRSLLDIEKPSDVECCEAFVTRILEEVGS